MIYNLKELQAEVTKIMKATISVCNKNKIAYYCQAGTVLGAVRHQGPIPWDYDADIIIPSNEIERFIDACTRELPKEYWVDYHTVFPEGLRRFPRIGKKGYSTEHLHLDVFILIGLPDTRREQMALIYEAQENHKEFAFYIHKMKKLLQSLKAGDIHECLLEIKKIIQNDTSFVERMDELCLRFPYETAQYVMNPFGKYREKNIFKKEVYGKGQIVPYSDFTVRVPAELDFYLKQYYGAYMKYPAQAEIDYAMNKKYKIKEIKK